MDPPLRRGAVSGAAGEDPGSGEVGAEFVIKGMCTRCV
jgi:hypothetical protein